MELERDFLDRVRRLPLDKQREVLDFVEFLERRTSPVTPHPSLCGMFADLGIQLSTEEIDEARREAWGGFARDDV